MNETSSMLWRRLDQPGHESSRLAHAQSRIVLAGTAVFDHEQQACRLDYTVECDPKWHTLSAKVAGWLGNASVAAEVVVDARQRWTLNGIECPQVAGCQDIDLSFSPSTNLLPIRRLALRVGERANVRAAWLRFPTFSLEPLDQVYEHVGDDCYRYESAGGDFVAALTVNSVGFVTNYPGLWQQELAG
jgi:hypothetical protein